MNDKFEVMIVPIDPNVSLLIPRKLVEFVLPYAKPLPSSYTHESLVGSIIYQNEKVPVLDARELYYRDEDWQDIDSGKRRIVIVSCITEHEEFSSYAVIADNNPRLFELAPGVLHETLDQVHEPFYSRVEIPNLPGYKILIPDLELLEKVVFE